MLFFVLGLVSGFGGPQKDAGGPPPPPPGKAGPVSYPLSGKSGGQIKFKYWMPIMNAAIQFINSYAENPAYQEIQKKTGVTIEFIHPTLGQQQEQFNLIIASGDLPDIMQQGYRYPGGGREKGYEDGVYVNLLPYLESWAPDYYKAINHDDTARLQTYSGKDKVLAFFPLNLSDPIPYYRPILRADWLKEFGMATPRTLDDYEKYFQNILARKPGVAPFQINFNHGTDLSLFMGPFEISSGWYQENGKVTHYYDHPRYREFLTRMNQWYNKGYISRDFATLNLQKIFALFDSGELGGYSESVDMTRVRAVSLGIPIESAPNPRMTPNQRLHNGPSYRPVNNALPFDTVITTQCKDPENAIKFLNFGYTEEGSRIYNYGVEGLTYNMVNGRPQFTELMLNNPKGLTTSNVNYIYKIHFGPKLALPDTICNPELVKDPAAVEWRLKWLDDPNIDDAYGMLLDALTVDEMGEFNRIMVDLSPYAEEMKLKFVTGAESLANFDAYIQKLYSMGFGRAKAIQQARYDRLNK
jgi:putative aldouronate transport system substrate-binding protein